ncbi:MAG TPA: DUF2461 domain-containing protein [Candidatus Sulfotelmatobacter sp.]|nr:DUF2461 domain-containing protein [Candidatus Sulfotelmatobacter sp.]
MASGGFQGIPPEASTFLKGLATHNDRLWFAEHKADYQTFVREPLRRLVEALAPDISRIDPGLDCNPMGPAVSRIQRDTRFSKDKSPYRLRQWVAFKPHTPEWFSRPVFFMEFGAEDWCWGIGYYAAAPATVAAVRAEAGRKPEPFARALNALRQAGAVFQGEAYRRPRTPAHLPDVVRDWCDRKSPYSECRSPVGRLSQSGELKDALAAGFATAVPLYQLLKDAAILTA